MVISLIAANFAAFVISMIVVFVSNPDIEEVKWPAQN